MNANHDAMLNQLCDELTKTGVADSEIDKAILLPGVIQWAEETIKWWESHFPPEQYESARAVLDGHWEKVTFTEDTAPVAFEFAKEIANLK